MVSHHRMVDRRHLLRSQGVGTEQPVDWFGMHVRQELAPWIRPLILLGTGDVDAGRGAISAISMCWSNGSCSSWSLYFLKLPQNQWGNDVLMRYTVSPNRRRLRAAPPQPESLEMTMANRVSSAPAHSAVLPSRECPSTATRWWSISGDVSK